MSKVKRTICLMTNWYPTEENPYQGVFFKEQAQALEKYFEVVVIHYIEKKRDGILKHFVRKQRKEQIQIDFLKEEINIQEYNVIVYLPRYIGYADKINTILPQRLKNLFYNNQNIDGLSGEQRRRKKIITEIFQKYFQKEIDVFYCVDAQTEGFVLQTAAKAIEKPYVVSEHAPFPNQGCVVSYADKCAIEKADAFFAISYDKIRQVLMQNINPSKIFYVGNMVDENQFGLKEDTSRVKTFIMVAANSFYKNYNLFIAIFNRLTEITDVPFNVMIVGYGANKGYSKNADELEERIRNSKFGNFTEMIREISHDCIHELYQRADAFVMTSIQEGMPVSALEAGCCGLPIFSTMCGGVEDYVDENVGKIYKIIDAESFANGLKDYLEGKIIFDRVAIRKAIVENYGKRIFVERIAKAFDEVISEKAKK